MGSLAVPTDKQITVDDNFNMYLAIATENSTSKNYDAEDVAQIKSLSKALSTEIEKIDGVLPSDRSFKIRGVKKATRNLVEGINKAKDEKYNKLYSRPRRKPFLALAKTSKKSSEHKNCATRSNSSPGTVH